MAERKTTEFFQYTDSKNRTFFRTAVLLWSILAAVLGALVAHHPLKSTVTNYYHDASMHWLARMNLYDGGHLAMNYLPQFAIIFSLFHILPVPLGDILWRVLAVALLATGAWRFVKQIFGKAAPGVFFWVTLMALPLSAAALRNGQANTLLGALMLHAAASISMKKWWSAAALIMLAIVAKPVALVLLLLAVVVYRPLRLPAVACLAALAVFPFLFARPDYVMGQCRAFAVNLQDCATVTEYDYADITGMLWPFHIQLPPLVSQIVRSSAGLVTLAFWWWGARRMREPVRAFWLLTLADAYLMLFNPMNESNSYVIIAPVLAIWAVFFLDRGQVRIGGAIAFMVLSMGLLPNLLRPFFGNKFALFYHPMMTILFSIALVVCIWREKKLPFGSPETAVS